jgi:MFS family permease
VALDLRPLGVATAGSCVNLYSPQALLPQFAGEFHVGHGEISSLMTAGTGAIALTAPFTGVLADIVGRKRLITAAMFLIVVPTVIMTFATTARPAQSRVHRWFLANTAAWTCHLLKPYCSFLRNATTFA